MTKYFQILIAVCFMNLVKASDTAIYRYSIEPRFSMDNYNFHYINGDRSGFHNFKTITKQNFSFEINWTSHFHSRYYLNVGIGYSTFDFVEKYDNTGYHDFAFDYINYYQRYLTVNLRIGYKIIYTKRFTLAAELGIKPMYKFDDYSIEGFNDQRLGGQHTFYGGGFFKTVLLQGIVSVVPKINIVKRVQLALPFSFLYLPQQVGSNISSAFTIGYNMGVALIVNLD